MREILFKAKRKNWLELPKEEWWVEGYLFDNDIPTDKRYYIGQLTIEPYKGTAEDHWDITGKYFYEIDPETLCQYTGMTDKNGVRIWENDILRRAYHLEDDCIVVWHDGRFNFKTIHGQYNQDPMTLLSLCFISKSVERLKVVGNVFDNPELLRKG